MTVPRSSIDRRIDSCVRADRHLHQVSLIAEDLALGEPAARPNSARDDDVDHQRLVVASTIGGEFAPTDETLEDQLVGRISRFNLRQIKVARAFEC